MYSFQDYYFKNWENKNYLWWCTSVLFYVRALCFARNIRLNSADLKKKKDFIGLCTWDVTHGSGFRHSLILGIMILLLEFWLCFFQFFLVFPSFYGVFFWTASLLIEEEWLSQSLTWQPYPTCLLDEKKVAYLCLTIPRRSEIRSD